MTHVNMALLMLAALLILWGTETPPERSALERQQCEMWEIWHSERRAGVELGKRYGWPDQGGRYYKECEQ